MPGEKTLTVKTLAIIPARGGSKGVPGKNIRKLGGYPLIAYSIAAAKLSAQIDRVVVSTDSEEIAGIARIFGAEVPFLRPACFSGDESPDRQFVIHAIKWFDEHEGGNIPEYMVHLRPTTPLRDSAVIDKAIEAIKKNPEATSLRSAHPAPESPFKWFAKDDKGYFKSLLAGCSNDDINGARQSFPEAYIPNGYVDVLKTSFVVSSGLLHGNKMMAFESPPCREVDTLEDFKFIKFELENTKCALWEYLVREFPG